MHLTYHDSQPHTSAVSAPSAEAGAPEIEVTPAMIEAVDDILLRELIWLEGCSEEYRHTVISRMIRALLIQQRSCS
jgi:hypothetical protein